MMHLLKGMDASAFRWEEDSFVLSDITGMTASSTIGLNGSIKSSIRLNALYWFECQIPLARRNPDAAAYLAISALRIEYP